MAAAQEGPALGQVSWDREQWYRRASSGIDRHVQGVAQSFLNLGSGGSRGSSPGGTGQDENRFSPLHGRAGHGPTHHPGPLHHHDTAVGCDLRGRGFVPLPQDPLPYQDEDPLLEQLSPYGELGSGGAGGHHPGGPAHRRGECQCAKLMCPPGRVSDQLLWPVVPALHDGGGDGNHSVSITHPGTGHHRAHST